MRLVFLGLDIEVRNGKFRVGLFDKRDSFPFSIVTVLNKSSNVTMKIVYSAIGAEYLRTATESNTPDSAVNHLLPT